VHRTDYEENITTGWLSEPKTPDVCRRLSVTIQPSIGFREMPPAEAVRRSVWVRAYRQEKGRFGLWVEHTANPAFQETRAYEQTIELEIESRSENFSEMEF
jgi:hypothetical protein